MHVSLLACQRGVSWLWSAVLELAIDEQAVRADLHMIIMRKGRGDCAGAGSWPHDDHMFRGDCTLHQLPGLGFLKVDGYRIC